MENKNMMSFKEFKLEKIEIGEEEGLEGIVLPKAPEDLEGFEYEEASDERDEQFKKDLYYQKNRQNGGHKSVLSDILKKRSEDNYELEEA